MDSTKDKGQAARIKRGITLAAAYAATLHGDLWIVRGTARNYTVNLERETCNCPDHQNQGRDAGQPCKHIYAATVTAARGACRPRRVRIIRH